jgi:hypothetical protein
MGGATSTVESPRDTPTLPGGSIPVTATTAPAASRPVRFVARPSLPGVAAAAAALSATILVTTMAFLVVAHVAGGPRFGDGGHSAIVDAFDALAILLLLPIPFALHELLAGVDRRGSAAAVALAVDAIVFGSVLHAAFALEIVRFEAAGPLLAIGYAAFVGWLWIVGTLGERDGTLPNGGRLALVGATVVGLPIWLLVVGRRLTSPSAA